MSETNLAKTSVEIRGMCCLTSTDGSNTVVNPTKPHHNRLENTDRVEKEGKRGADTDSGLRAKAEAEQAGGSCTPHRASGDWPYGPNQR